MEIINETVSIHYTRVNIASYGYSNVYVQLIMPACSMQYPCVVQFL